MAFTQGSLTTRRIVAGTLFLLGEELANRQELEPPRPKAAIPPPGRYLLKAYLDRQHRLSDDPTVFLGDANFVGQVEIQAQWREGFPEAEKISGNWTTVGN